MAFVRLSQLLLLCVSAAAADWNQWRGPQRDGVANSLQLPASWPASLTKAWTVQSGSGYSSPVVSSTHAFLLVRQADNEVVESIDLGTGKVAWRNTYPAPFSKSQYALQMAAGPFSTPLLDRNRLYTLGVTAILSCFDANTGRLLWRNDYSKRVDTGKLFTGTAMSPLIDDSALIIHIGDDTKGTLTALDPATGAEKWKWEEDGPGYASPIVAVIDGTRQIITLTDKRVIALHAAGGRLLWTVPFADQWNENIVTPVQHGNRIVVSGVRNGTFAIDVSLAAGRWIARQSWQSKDAPMYMSSPIVDGGHLYGFSSRKKGQFFCQDIATGKVLWASEGRSGDGASLISAGRVILALTVNGELLAIRRSPQRYDRLARYQVAATGTWPHLTPVLDGVLVKDQTSLTRWKLPPAR